MDNKTDHIREAEIRDASRLAEILVFSKRKHYREIFRDDAFSFGVLQVLPVAQDLMTHPEKLKGYRVYDDGFVKGLIRLEEDEIGELYIDPFFEGQGLGSMLMTYAKAQILHPRLWVLDGNAAAIRFYQKHGFVFTEEQKFVPGTDKTESRMVHRGPVSGDIIGKTVRVTVDRPLGSCHPDHPEMVYPVNYGYVEGVPGGDGEDQDAYILGIDRPVKEAVGKVAAIIRRDDDCEDKWVVAPSGICFSVSEIYEKTFFQERYFRSRILPDEGNGRK